MSFQSCPHCKGVGYIALVSTTSCNTCPVCLGKKIIHTETGLPPTLIVTHTNEDSYKGKDSGDFRDGPMESQQEYFGKQ